MPFSPLDPQRRVAFISMHGCPVARLGERETGGMNVSSLEVETVVMDIPGVREVAVVGLPDDRWSEVVTAFVVRTADGAVDEARIRDISRKHLAAYKVPKAVRFVEALPRDEQGKVRKRMLRDSA